MPDKKYLTPSCYELYRAPRGTIGAIDQLSIPVVSKVNALIDFRAATNTIGESQAIEVLNTARSVVAETIQLN